MIGNRCKAAALLIVGALALAGCGRGGKAFSGEGAVALPQPPAEAKRWVNSSLDLAAAKGKVLLVEAWHPS